MVHDGTAETAGPVRSGPRPWHVVAVLLATGLAAVVPTAATSSAALPASVVLLVVLSALAVQSSSGAMRQSVLLVDLLFVAVAVGFLGLWPVPAAIAVVLGGGSAAEASSSTGGARGVAGAAGRRTSRG